MTDNEEFEQIVANPFPQDAAPLPPLMSGVTYTSRKLHKKGALVIATSATITEGHGEPLGAGQVALTVFSITGTVYTRVATYAQEAGVYPNTWSLS